MKVFLPFKKRSPESLECIPFLETGNFSDEIEGGLIDGLKHVMVSGFLKSLFATSSEIGAVDLGCVNTKDILVPLLLMKEDLNK